MTAVPPPRSEFVSLRGSRRHMLRWGAADAPVLLLLHGMRDHAHSWAWVAAHFADRYHVIAPDLRGHGDSDWAEEGGYTIANYVADLAGIVDALALPPFALLGHSLGGHIALHFAGCFPETVSRLCVIEGVELPITRDERAAPRPYALRLREWIELEQDRSGRSPRYYRTVAEAEARMAAQHGGIDAATIAHLTRHGLIAEAGRGLRWKYDNACRHRAPDDAHGADIDDILSAVTCPTLLAYGDRSWVPLPPEDRLARLRARELVVFAGASHWLHHQARQPFLEALDRFLGKAATPEPAERECHA